MYVKTFEGETLDEALKSVKHELGPDAIILKTVTNKGLKGAFKKGRIEITAAISEQNYARKAKVDKVFTEDQKENFYNSPASAISESIDTYNRPAGTSTSPQNYGNLGLNKVVKTVKDASDKIKHSLDDFLGAPPTDDARPQMMDSIMQEEVAIPQAPVQREERVPAPQVTSTIDHSEIDKLKKLLQTQAHQIKVLEDRLSEVSSNQYQNKPEDQETGLSQLRIHLKTLDLSDKLVSDLCKKIIFELSKPELENADIVFEMALRILNDMIRVDMPLFSRTDTAEGPVITTLVSEVSCGQSSSVLKLAGLRENTKVICYRKNGNGKEHEFTKSMLNLDVTVLNSLPEVITAARKSMQKAEHIILDLKFSNNEDEENKKFLNTLTKTFKNVQVIGTLSALQTEIYNRKILSKYKDFVSGTIITYMDQCLSYGPLINAQYAFKNMPFIFYSTGPVVPEDIESATSERIIASMFEL
jgi:flagellar biosynthesis protein FlhF